MTQYVLERPDELINYIRNISDACKNEIFNVRINLTNPLLINILICHTKLPSVLIAIVNSYIAEEINIHIKHAIYRKPHYYAYNNQYLHTHFYFDIIDGEFTKKIKFTSCDFNFSHRYVLKLTNWCPQTVKCEASVRISNVNTTILSREMMEYCNWFEHNEKSLEIFLEKLFEITNEYYSNDYSNDNNDLNEMQLKEYLNHLFSSMNHTDLNDVRSGEYSFGNVSYVYNNDLYECALRNDVHDDNLFFNCFSDQMQQNHNKIKHNTSNIHKLKNSTYISKCKYNEKQKCYDHITINKHKIIMTRHIINNHEKLTKLITISNMLYEIINEQFKHVCNDRAKVKKLNKIALNYH